MKKQLLISLLIFLVFLITGCEESGTKFQTDCGVVLEKRVFNPISDEDAIRVDILSIEDSNLVIGRDSDGYVRSYILHGLSDAVSDAVRQQAIRMLRSLGEETFFYQAKKDCTAKIGNDIDGIPGQLFTLDGVSYSEELLRAGYAVIDTRNRCDSELIRDCQAALLALASPGGGGGTGTQISNFLWKPESERDGNLVVLLDPEGATVTAGGEVLFNRGPSNGRGTTARGNQPGCAYGKNVEVSAVDRKGRSLIFPGGGTSLIIKDGCLREEH